MDTKKERIEIERTRWSQMSNEAREMFKKEYYVIIIEDAQRHI